MIDCHPLAGLFDPARQSWEGVQGLIVHVHGEFYEAESGTQKAGKRSFSRTFILGPGQTNPIRVANDTLTLKEWKPIPKTGEGQAADPNANMVLELDPSIEY